MLPVVQQEDGWEHTGGAGGKEPTCQCRQTKETQVRPLGQEHTVEEGTAAHSSVLAQRIPRQRSLAGCSPQGRAESDTFEVT